MLDGVMMQEIFHFKEHGYTPGEIIEHYQRTGRKPPSMPTVMKYYNMEAPPENPGAKLAKKKAFDREPYRSAIIRALTNNPGCCVSSVYDVLVESFGEGGKPGGLPGNQQTLRNYVRHLAATGAIPSAEEGGASTTTFSTCLRANRCLWTLGWSRRRRARPSTSYACCSGTAGC